MEVVYDRGNSLSYTFTITVLPDTVLRISYRKVSIQNDF